MKNRYKLFRNLFLGLVLMTVLEGCTVLGIGIGAIADSKKQKQKPYQTTAEQSENIETQTHVVCTLKDGSRIRGTYQFIKPLTDGDYAVEYNKYQALLNHQLPSLDDTVKITSVYSTENLKQGRLYGFEFNKVLLISLDSNAVVDTVDIEGLVTITDNKGNQYEGELIRSLNGNLPVRTAIIILNAYNNYMYIQLNEIQTIKVGKAKNGILIGGCIGLAIDVAIITATIISMQDMSYGFSM